MDYKLCCCFWVAVSSEMASNSNVLFQKRFAVASFGGWNGELPSCNPLRVVRLSALWHLVGQPSAHWTQPSLTLWPQHADVRANLWTQTSARPARPQVHRGAPWGNPGGRPGWVDLEALTGREWNLPTRKLTRRDLTNPSRDELWLASQPSLSGVSEL